MERHIVLYIYTSLNLIKRESFLEKFDILNACFISKISLNILKSLDIK